MIHLMIVISYCTTKFMMFLILWIFIQVIKKKILKTIFSIGGAELVTDDAGRDATETFESAGHHITPYHLKFMEKFYKGEIEK